MRLKDLREPFLRPLEANDLDWTDEPMCEHKGHKSDDNELAHYIAGGKIQGGFWAGWWLCAKHAQGFSQKTGLRLPPMTG